MEIPFYFVVCDFLINLNVKYIKRNYMYDAYWTR